MLEVLEILGICYAMLFMIDHAPLVVSAPIVIVVLILTVKAIFRQCEWGKDNG